MASKRRETAAIGLLWGAGIATLVILIVILAYILVNGLPLISWHFLTANPGIRGEAGTGIYSTIVATLAVTGVALLVAAPLSVGGAIYLNEYTKENLLRKIIRQAAEGYGRHTVHHYRPLRFHLFCHLFTALHWRMVCTPLRRAGARIMVLPISLRISEESVESRPGRAAGRQLRLRCDEMAVDYYRNLAYSAPRNHHRTHSRRWPCYRRDCGHLAYCRRCFGVDPQRARSLLPNDLVYL